MIELREMDFSYPDGTRVFERLSIAVSEGERVGLVGRIGSGKSTLLRLVMGLIQPSAGEVLLFESACRREEEFAHARRRMGFLFQDSDDQLFCPSVEEDIAFGPLNLGRTHAEARRDVEEICGLLGIEHLMHRITHRLSGGQKRLVALATAAAMRPDIMILDEPAAGLDEQGKETLIQYLRAHCRTALIASHDTGFLDAVNARRVSL